MDRYRCENGHEFDESEAGTRRECPGGESWMRSETYMVCPVCGETDMQLIVDEEEAA